MTLAVRYAVRSDVGLLRDGNEDSAYASPRLLAIADGMGGHVAGEVASSLVIARLARLDDDTPGHDLLGALAEATRDANDTLRSSMRADPRLQGMGTTLTALLVDGSRAGLAHVGDSRGYLLRGGDLAQITHDHSLVQSLVDEGQITAEQAATHPKRALILRAIDGTSGVEPDLAVHELQVGDRFLLCSDGLTDVVSDRTIAEALQRESTAESACEALVALALRAGGPDNITCLVVDIVDGPGSDGVVVAGAAAERDIPNVPDLTTASGRAAHATRPVPRVDHSPPPPPPAPPTAHDDERAAGRRRRAARIGIAVVGVVVVLAAGIIGAWSYVRSQYFVGVSNSRVAIYQGLQGSFLSASLSTVHQRTEIAVGQLPPWEQPRVEAGIDAENLSDAQHIVAQLRAEAVTP